MFLNTQHILSIELDLVCHLLSMWCYTITFGFGLNLSLGLGAGSRPQVGSIGVNYNQSKIENLITTSPTVFIADGGQFF